MLKKKSRGVVELLRSCIGKLSLVAVIAALFVSCIGYTGEDGQGKLVINNDAGDGRYISSVWIKEADSDGYTCCWRNASKSQTACNIYLDAGEYDVRIYVVMPGSLFDSQAYYETGYKNPVEIKDGEYAFLCFDGLGVYKLYE